MKEILQKSQKPLAFFACLCYNAVIERFLSYYRSEVPTFGGICVHGIFTHE